jgi:hypothetical protein
MGSRFRRALQVVGFPLTRQDRFPIIPVADYETATVKRAGGLATASLPESVHLE